jgi:5'-methylthioadenosine phosphorylase
MTLAIIGGTGVYDLGGLTTPEAVDTPFGAVAVFRVEVAGTPVIFLPRHGVGHSVPPHRINYRANIWALHALGVREVLATQAVGSLNMRMAPGHFVLLAQFLDFTKVRPITFFDGDGGPVVHVDVTRPYCPRLTGHLLRASEFLGDRVHGEAVYACTEGPRFETTAEIHALRTLGADLVGMTNVPEVVLAREAGLCYAAVSIVCNWAAGMTNYPLTQDEVLEIMREQTAELRDVIARFVALPRGGDCPCAGLGFPQFLPG